MKIRIAACAVLLVAAACTGNDGDPPDSTGGTATESANIVFIMVDDLSANAFERGFNRSLDERSALVEDLIQQGATLPNFFFPTPLCCPSRASFLTGQYPHNHRVYTNSPTGAENDNGGLLRFWLDERDASSLGVWMQSAGYRTGLVGKYLNGYPNRQFLKDRGVPEEYVPRGWDDWHAVFHNDKAAFAPFDFGYYSFRANDNGEVGVYGDGATYLTDWERDNALRFLDQAAAGDEPFMLWLAPYAPHGPVQPRADHAGLHAAALGRDRSEGPSCNEADLSDKPAWIRAEPDLRSFPNGCGANNRVLDMTLAVDELIAAVVAKLDELGILTETYVFFASDNGLLTGQHRIAGKSAPYEESVRVPMVVRGPGVEPGVVLPHLAMNVDFAPTFLDIAGAVAPAADPAIDGESLLDVVSGRVDGVDWRTAVLLEMLVPLSSPNQPHTVPPYRAVRTDRHVWIEYATGETELYDLEVDPAQLDSLHDRAPPELVAGLRSRLAALAGCAGSDCAAAARG